MRKCYFCIEGWKVILSVPKSMLKLRTSGCWAIPE